MKIIYIYPALDTVGGADRIIIEKANYFADKLNYEVFIITAHQCGKPIFFPLSEKVKHIDLDVDFNEQYNHSLFIRSYYYIKLLRHYKRKLSVYLTSLKADFVITTISRDIDFLYKLKDGSIKIAESHTPKEYIRNLHLLKRQGFLYRIVAYIWTRKLEKAIRHFDALVVLTEKEVLKWKKIKPAIVIPNFCDFTPSKTSTCKEKHVISVGRLEEQKGYDMLIKAWSLVSLNNPEWKLSIYGEGVLLNKLIEMTHIFGVGDSIQFKKPVKNIIDKYLESSIYVLSSRFEGFGLVLIEAMACGLPVISFDCPEGPSEIINDGSNGFLVQNGNIELLAEKINFLIKDEELRIKMGDNARIDVLRYSPDIIMKKWINLFESLQPNDK